MVSLAKIFLRESTSALNPLHSGWWLTHTRLAPGVGAHASKCVVHHQLPGLMEKLDAVPEVREIPRYSLKEILMAAILLIMFQKPSRHAVNQGGKVYQRHVLEAKRVCPNGFAISLASEFIENRHGSSKQDCELKASL